MFGKDRELIWNYLDTSIEAGDSLFVMSQENDWKIGDRVVIASNSYDMNESEVKTIIDIQGNTFIVDSPFDYNHYSEIETYGETELSLNCLVGLLTRNIVFKGSDDDSDSGYGAYMKFDGTKNDGL
jgi:hypothetical protein